MSSNSKKIILAIVGVTIVFTLLFLLRKTEKEKITVRDFAAIKHSGRLNVVTDRSSLGFSISENKIVGFNYDIVKAFADSMGLELNVSMQNNLDSCFLGLQNGTYDLIAVNLPTVAPLKSKLAFSTPIYNSRLVLIEVSDSAYNTDKTNYRFLTRDSICIPIASPHKYRLENLSNEIANPIKIVELRGKTSEDLAKMVSEGKIKYTVCDELQARRLQKKYSNINIETAVGFNQPLAWAVSPNSKELLEQLNHFLNDFLSSSEYWNIYRRYF